MEDNITTRHADLRLMQRAGEFDKSMTEVWEAGIPCEVKGRSYDEARLCPEYDVVLLMQNEKIITVLSVSKDVTVDGEGFQSYLDSRI